MDGETEAYICDSADLGDSTSANPALTFRAGELVKRWLFGPQVDEPLAYEAYTGTTTAGSGSVIELLANRLGSIITAISISTGAVAADYDYQAYGARVETGALEQPYGFTGREHDAESGLIHLRARAYDPETGSFLQVDPIGFAGGQGNLFAYGANNPISGSDPSGLSFLSTRQINDATAQMKGAALTRVSDGVLSLGIGIAEALSQAARGMLVSPTAIDPLGPADGSGSNHCNAKSNQIGNHAYMIDARQDGVPRKVGIANNKRLTPDGYHSYRALEQIATYPNPRAYNHVVILKTPDGYISRYFALVIEQALVDYVYNAFGPGALDPKKHKLPQPTQCKL